MAESGIVRPRPRFKPGDLIVENDGFTLGVLTVTRVRQDCVDGAWREYIGYRTANGWGAGNADLFRLATQHQEDGT